MTQELPEGTVTILFTDVVGSTELRTRRGDDAAHELLRAHFDLVRSQIKQHSGQEVKTMGDGFMVAFASARRAVACAIAIQKAMCERNLRHAPGNQVHVRIGLNTGEVLEEDRDLFGEAVNAAARVAAKAKGGQILISEAGRGVLGRAQDIQLIDRGRFRLKGFPERWRLHEVVWQGGAPTVAPPALAERTPFVGRGEERATLGRLLDQAAQGRGGLVLVGGEPGVGKTRLTEEVMAEARARGLFTVAGHCYEMEGAPPYIPFTEILEYVCRVAPPDLLRETLGDAAPEVAKLAPRLRQLFPDLPPPIELPPEQERRFMFENIREYLERASRAQTMLLVLEDLHWADEGTLSLFGHLAPGLAELPLLIIGTYRDVELDINRPLAKTLDDLLRGRLARDVSLARLPRDGVVAMLRGLVGQEPPRTVVEAVYSETEGVPFFVEEVFKYLMEEGRLLDSAGLWRDDLRVDELEVPRGVRLVIGRRLQRVGEATRQALTVASVVGRAFTYELLQALAELDEDSLLDAIDEAERSHLIISAAEGREARFTFAHELIRQTLVTGVSLPRRQRLHLRVVDAIERAYSGSIEEHAADLAHHLFQAGAAADPEKTVRYQATAGDQALQEAAFEDALKLYENGLSIAGPDDRRTHSDLLYKRGVALRSLGRRGEALADWDAAAAICESLGDSETVGRISAETCYELVWAGLYDQGLLAAQRGLAALGERVNADRCRLLAHMANTLAWLPDADYAAAEAMLGEAVELAEELGDQRTLGIVLRERADAAGVAFMHLPEAFEDALRAGRMLRLPGALYDAASALLIAQACALGLGRLEEGEGIAGELEPLARFGNESAGQFAIVFRAQINLMRSGDIHEYTKRCEEALQVSVASNNAIVIGFCHFWLATTEFWSGRWREAGEHLKQGLESEVPGFALIHGGSLFKLRAYSGAREEALSILRERRSDLPAAGRPISSYACEMLLAVIEGLALLDCKDEVADLYPSRPGGCRHWNSGGWNNREWGIVAVAEGGRHRGWLRRTLGGGRTALRSGAPPGARDSSPHRAARGAPLVCADAPRTRWARRPRQGLPAPQRSDRHVSRDRHAEAR